MNRNIVYLSMLCVLFLNTLSAQNRTTTTQENVRLLESSVLDSLLLLEEQLDEVVVVSTGVSRLKQSAFNAVALDTEELQNSTKNLSEALSKAPGMKLRESGGVGSDMQLTLDGFSGKHVKVFIDGVPQEGVGDAFSLNNIPVNFADHIEVYKGGGTGWLRSGCHRWGDQHCDQAEASSLVSRCLIFLRLFQYTQIQSAFRTELEKWVDV